MPIDGISKKIKRNLRLLYRIRNNLKDDGLRDAYFIMFNHIFLYGCCVWGFSTKMQINRLVLMQKRIIRALSFASSRAHT
ncbi:hypothetical protein B4U79_01107 [Dinothrombium tinctorium]|uniref:Uncharacterized protein n=1 Tax=Dinothrombium tinctorium TaxID=1965070 RepID=A0A3S4QCA3_9ACAR|nr:hypothetical protein B4U79_01107 [Dinothrombium tinctorium]